MLSSNRLYKRNVCIFVVYGIVDLNYLIVYTYVMAGLASYIL